MEQITARKFTGIRVSNHNNVMIDIYTVTCFEVTARHLYIISVYITSQMAKQSLFFAQRFLIQINK